MKLKHAQIAAKRNTPRWAIILLLTLASAACLKATRPNLPKIFQARNTNAKRPLIIIPGILGSELVNAKTGERVWPELFPRNDQALTLPIESLDFRRNCDELVAARVIETADLGRFIPQIGVYSGLLNALESYGGYRRGEIDQPPADGDHDTYYLFAYDWRRDNVESAQLLAHKLETLKQRLGKPDLRFDLIAHSMGGLIARYYAMYGEHDVLDDAELRPDWSGAQHLARLMLIGTPNAGSLDALRSLVRGYSVTEAHHPRVELFRSLGRRTIFSAPSVYQLLPRNEAARFFDEQLQSLRINLFELETWRRWHWSAAFDPAVAQSERKELSKRLGATKAEDEINRAGTGRERFLRSALARAVAFHQAIDAAGSPPEAIRLHLFGGDCEPTLAGALLVNLPGTTQTQFYPRGLPGGRKANRRAYELLFLPGDGRVTRQSLFGLTLNLESGNRAMKFAPSHSTFNCDLHGDLPLNLILQNNLLTLLLSRDQ